VEAAKFAKRLKIDVPRGTKSGNYVTTGDIAGVVLLNFLPQTVEGIKGKKRK
jgi:hypothetical protein